MQNEKGVVVAPTEGDKVWSDYKGPKWIEYWGRNIHRWNDLSVGRSCVATETRTILCLDLVVKKYCTLCCCRQVPLSIRRWNFT
jgi:hypothetical protein